MKKAVLWVACAMMALMASGCGNRNPVIDSNSSLPGPDWEVAFVGERTEFNVSASDPDGDPLLFSWTITGGTLDSDVGNIVHWTAPAQPGICTVTVTAHDDKGGESSHSRVIPVVRRAVQQFFPIEGDTTWWGGQVIDVQQQVVVKSSLTIKPGAIIKFRPGAGLIILSAASITAEGTADRRIMFTSYRDDSVGGDTDGDGGAILPGPGNWDYVKAEGGNRAVFDYCDFRYGGGNSYYDCTLWVMETGAVTNCAFRNNTGEEEGTLRALSDTGDIEIRNNMFSRNVKPLVISAAVSLDASNQFSEMPFIPLSIPIPQPYVNQYQAVYVSDSSYTTLNLPVVWQETEVAFVLSLSDLDVGSTGSLTLADGVVLKFGTNGCLRFSGSNLINHDGTGVLFTSAADDAHGGDSNGDGNATLPAADSWRGIYNYSNSTWPSWSNILYN